MTSLSAHASAGAGILCFGIPTLFLLLGYGAVPYPQPDVLITILYLPLFLGLILLGIGVVMRSSSIRCWLKSLGWVMFSFYWAMQPKSLYFSEGGDVFNAAVCIIGVYILIYMAYQEWLSLHLEDFPSALNWIAGGTCIAGIIYFSLDTNLYPALKEGLIELVADQSLGLLTLFGIDAVRYEATIVYSNTPITIIFACTAIQSMVLFIGMIGALPALSVKRKGLALVVTVIPIYFLNLIRNAGVVYLVGSGLTSFELAHNVIAKIGSLAALIALLFLTFRIIPELYDEIMGIFDLTKRKGPIEQWLRALFGKKPS